MDQSLPVGEVTMMRIAVGQLWQETNTFNRNPTTLSDFDNWGMATGDQLIEAYSQTGELGGFLSQCRQWNGDVEFVGLARFACWPWGPVDRTTWSQIQATFSKLLGEAGPLDAVFLALHGAMAADGEEDLTGALLEQVRSAVGPNVPVVATLDLHANLTRKMVQNADLLIGYHTCPHLDSFETGARAANGLREILEEGVHPVTHWKKLPMITAAENHNTFTGPPAPLYRRLAQLEAEPDILSAGIYMAMPWLDCAELGWSVLLTTSGRSARAKQTVDEISEACWNLREAMENVNRFEPAEVVDKALRHGGHPIVIGDGADATNSGSPGDQTHLLRALLDRESIPHGALIFLVDPEAVHQAEMVGPGGTFLSMVGANFAPEYCEPVELRGTVERLLDIDFILDGHIGKNLPIHMGRGAVIRSGDVYVLLTEKSGPGSSPQLYETAGLDPKSCGIVIAKSPAGFRAEYEPFTAATFLSDCPGCASPNWQRLNYFRIDRPLWPFDAIRHADDAPWSSKSRHGRK